MTNDVKAYEHVIEIEDLITGFGDIIIHDHLDLAVRRGEVIGVVGGSGTGKSVLLKTIISLIKPRSGNIRIFGQNALSLNETEQRQLDRRLGVLFQDGALFSSMTVAQNIMAPLREHLDISDALASEIAAMKITMSGLPLDAAIKYPSELSGGMRKRAGLARALAMDPEIVFLDEPTAGLDPIGAAKFDELILSLQETLGLTVFMVTHDLDSLNRITDRIAVLADKKVSAIGPIEDVRQDSHPWIQEYFSGPRGRAAMVSTSQLSEAGTGHA
ncbi:MAG: ABC transporter ATP-binding protein [Aquisalinus sp.]|nr:ABC transporter ATP-binding protein [Aquisalinus sp.]